MDRQKVLLSSLTVLVAFLAIGALAWMGDRGWMGPRAAKIEKPEEWLAPTYEVVEVSRFCDTLGRAYEGGSGPQSFYLLKPTSGQGGLVLAQSGQYAWRVGKLVKLVKNPTSSITRVWLVDEQGLMTSLGGYCVAPH